MRVEIGRVEGTPDTATNVTRAIEIAERTIMTPLILEVVRQEASETVMAAVINDTTKTWRSVVPQLLQGNHGTH